MTERSYRIVLGLLLMLILYFQSQQGVILFIALLVFEGITNWRLPLIVTRLRSGKPQADPM
ncbi:MAG TPA: hypothetical protein VFR01_05790, partial [Geobacterales bacterium]|nr:hypothetical protein [Geobacterales bacterium]